LYMENYIRQTSFLKLVARCSNTKEALSLLQSTNIHLIFMDIGVEGAEDREFLHKLSNMKPALIPLVTFITSTDRFTKNDCNINTASLLLKPVSYVKFIEAALRAKTQLSYANTAYSDRDFLFLRVEFELIKVYMKDILYAEDFKDYVRVYTKIHTGYLKALITMKNLRDKLPSGSFVSVHRSFIVSVDKIDGTTKNTMRIGKTIIPVNSQYREDFKRFS